LQPLAWLRHRFHL